MWLRLELKETNTAPSKSIYHPDMFERICLRSFYDSTEAVEDTS